MGIFAPIVIYWLYAGFYQLFLPLENYRLHAKKEEEEKNLVVVKGVLLQPPVQAVVAHVLFVVSYWTYSSSSCLPFILLCCEIMILLMWTMKVFSDIDLFLYEKTQLVEKMMQV